MLILTSRLWRHDVIFFWSTLGWFCRQIISRKSHRRNFLNLLPFKSYKQKSKSWVISPPPPLPYKGLKTCASPHSTSSKVAGWSRIGSNRTELISKFFYYRGRPYMTSRDFGRFLTPLVTRRHKKSDPPQIWRHNALTPPPPLKKHFHFIAIKT